jgi:hypothetical protein
MDLSVGKEPSQIRVIQIDYSPVFLRAKSVQVLGTGGMSNL